jgi:acyl homoserine lactone synthase
MEIQAGVPGKLAPGVMAGLARYRHKVFIEKLGWELPSAQGLELDQYDRDDTLYVVARSPVGDVIGTARLLPTVRPYLLGEVFPQLMGGHPPPCDPEVWELSRFAATDVQSADGNALSQFSSPVVIALLEEVLMVAARHAVRRLITVSPLGVERLLRRYGFVACRAGPPLVINGHPIFACWIEVGQRLIRPACICG